MDIKYMDPNEKINVKAIKPPKSLVFLPEIISIPL
jgi:hypothetical protein